MIGTKLILIIAKNNNNYHKNNNSNNIADFLLLREYIHLFTWMSEVKTKTFLSYHFRWQDLYYVHFRDDEIETE